MANRNQFTPDEEKIDAALAQVVAANVDQELHVGVSEEGGLALGARLVLHFDQVCKISQLSETTSRIFCVCFDTVGFEVCRCAERYFKVDE